MTRSQFLVAAAVGIAGAGSSSPADAELMIQIVSPQNVGESGFEVGVARREGGMLSFSILRKQSKAESTLRLSIGPEDRPIVVAFLEPKEATLRTRRALEYRFEVSEEHLSQARLQAFDGAPKQLGGAVFRFDLKSFLEARAAK